MKKKLYVATLMMTLAMGMMGCGAKSEEHFSEAGVETAMETTVETIVETSEESIVETTVETNVETTMETAVETSVEDSAKTAADYYNAPENKAVLDEGIAALKEQFAGTFADFYVEVEGNVFSYIYVYNEEFTDEQIASASEALTTSLTEEAVSAAKTMLASECGVEDVQVRYVYMDKNEKVILDVTY